MGGRSGGNNIDVYVPSYTSYFMFCVYCPARTVCIYLPYMVKKMGIHSVLFTSLSCRKTPSLHLISSVSSDFCLARLKYIVRFLVSPSLLPTFSTFFSSFLPILLLLLLLSFFPIYFSHFSSLVSFTPIQKSMEKQDKCFAFGRCLRPRVSL